MTLDSVSQPCPVHEVTGSDSLGIGDHVFDSDDHGDDHGGDNDHDDDHGG